MMLVKHIAWLVLLMLLGGCEHVHVQSSQLMSIKNTFFPESTEVLSSPWQLQFGGYSAEVQPVTVGKNTVFVNKRSDAVTFDGWKVVKIMGLKSFSPAWEIQDVGRERRFSVNGEVVTTHYCDDWVRLEIAAGVRFEQSCTAKQAYTNMLLIDNLGRTINIVQVVDSSLMPLQVSLKN
jgi:hypothetical protein